MFVPLKHARPFFLLHWWRLSWNSFLCILQVSSVSSFPHIVMLLLLMASSSFEKAVVEAGGLKSTLGREWVFARGSGKARNVTFSSHQPETSNFFLYRQDISASSKIPGNSSVPRHRFLGTYSVSELESVCFVQNRHQDDGSQELFLCVLAMSQGWNTGKSL